MRHRTTSVSVSLLSSLTVLLVFGGAAAHATTASAANRTPKLTHTGNAYPDHTINTSASSATVATGRTGLKFVATFGSSITTDPNAAAIKKGITDDLTTLGSLIATPVTVTIAFESVSTGLGGAATYYNDEPYTTYRADLKHQAAASDYDNRALKSLPPTTANPVNGGPTVHMTLPLLRATGETAAGNVGAPVDSTIFLNTSIMNLSRSRHPDPTKYDLRQVAMHEIVEVLGAGGAGDSLLSSQVGPTDLFRYSADGVRSYTTDPTATAYFSINGGANNRGYFNQDSRGDYGDWSSDLNGRPQVQDAFSTPGVQLDLDNNEMIALDVVGYHLR